MVNFNQINNIPSGEVGCNNQILPDIVSRESKIYLRPLNIKLDNELSWSAIELIVREDASKFTRFKTNNLVLQEWAKKQSGEIEIKVNKLLKALNKTRSIHIGLSLDTPIIMGILNVTPDSFSDGGKFRSPQEAISAGIKMAANGATIIDIGGDSTRPKSSQPSFRDEESRILPVIAGIVRAGLTVSVDTRRSAIMKKAVKEGAAILNDVSSLSGSKDSEEVVASLGLPIILTHMQGVPENMQDNPFYHAAPFDIFDWFENKLRKCDAAGISLEKIIIDPGIGFGKTLSHNLEILSNLAIFHALGCHICIGVSRKAFIGDLTGEKNPRTRLPGSLAAILHCVNEGAKILRVHDVKETNQSLSVYNAINRRGLK